MLNEYEKLSLRKFKIKSILPDATILCLGRRRSGKCVGYDTDIIMFDGTIKKVQNIRVGDLLMGDDSTPRRVLGTNCGIDTLYCVTNKKGESYTVNSEHVLSLKYTGKKNICERKQKQAYVVSWFDKSKITFVSKHFSYINKSKTEAYAEAKLFFDNIIDDRYIDIPVKKFMSLSKKYKNFLHGYQVPLQFPETPLDIDPYMIGYWLGDGTSTTSQITCQDSTVLHYFANNLAQYKCCLRYQNNKGSKRAYNINGDGPGRANSNFFLNSLRKYNLISNKHIPHIFKCNSRKNRLELLAGFIDADGHLCRGCFEITQSAEHGTLIDDVIYLARSLGFSAYKKVKKTSWTHNGETKYGTAWRIHISGNGIHEIPTKVPRKKASPRKRKVDNLVSSIKVEEQPKGRFYGFELDGNHRFVLGNFIVTHNSFLVRDIFYHHREIPSGVVFSGTEAASPFFSEFIPSCFIHPEYDTDLINSIMVRQRKKLREAKEKGLSDTGKLPSNNVFIVLDDMLHDANVWKKDQTIKNIFYNGRHYNFLFILTMQYAQGIGPDLRSNIDYVFIFNEPSVANRRKIYDAYAGMIPTFDHFCNILDACTQDHECLVIKTCGNTNDLKDQIFWYKAEPHNNFRVGHSKFWKFHEKNFNENFEEDLDNDQVQIEKLRKKFAKTRKLKVIVSREKNKVIGYEQESE